VYPHCYVNPQTKHRCLILLLCTRIATSIRRPNTAVSSCYCVPAVLRQSADQTPLSHPATVYPQCYVNPQTKHRCLILLLCTRSATSVRRPNTAVSSWYPACSHCLPHFMFLSFRSTFRCSSVLFQSSCQ